MKRLLENSEVSVQFAQGRKAEQIHIGSPPISEEALIRIRSSRLYRRIYNPRVCILFSGLAYSWEYTLNNIMEKLVILNNADCYVLTSHKNNIRVRINGSDIIRVQRERG